MVSQKPPATVPQANMVQQATPIGVSMSGIDLQSSTPTTPNFIFLQSNEHKLPIALFKCTNVAAACQLLKQWTFQKFGQAALHIPNILRNEHLELETLRPGQGGTLVWLEGAAHLSGDRAVPVSIIAVFVPRDPKVRWCWSVQDVSSALRWLEDRRYIQLAKALAPGTPSHKRFFTFQRGAFEDVIQLPEYADYQTAMKITDYAVDVIDEHPDGTALQRLNQNDLLYYSKEGKDLEHDRYLLHLHPAERELASISDISCAEYLMIKRLFFKDFANDVLRNKEKIIPDPRAGGRPTREQTRQPGNQRGERSERGKHESTASPTPQPRQQLSRGQRAARGRAKVRSEHANLRWLETEFDWGHTRAKKLIVGWEILGLLDEARYLSWAKEGGMFEDIGLEEEGHEE